MISTAIRLAKGAYVAFAFALFAGGIALALLFVVPTTRVLFSAERRVQATRGAVRLLIGFWLRVLSLGGLVRLGSVSGQPAPGPCIMVSNHPGLFDILFLICQIPDLAVLVKPTLATRLPLRPVFRALDYVVASDGESQTALDTLLQLRARVRSGWRVFLFPEGTRSPKGRVGTFRAGAFRLARLTGVPVQPVLIRNDPPFMPHEDPWYLPARSATTVDLEFLAPLEPIEAGQERSVANALKKRLEGKLILREGLLSQQNGS